MEAKLRVFGLFSSRTLYLFLSLFSESVCVFPPNLFYIFYIYSTKHFCIPISMHNLIKWDYICGYNFFFFLLYFFVFQVLFFCCLSYFRNWIFVAVIFFYYSDCDCTLKIYSDWFVLFYLVYHQFAIYFHRNDCALVLFAFLFYFLLNFFNLINSQWLWWFFFSNFWESFFRYLFLFIYLD